MKFILKLFILLIIDLLIIIPWVSHLDPDPSVAIGLIILVPLVFGINIIIALCLLFTSQKQYSPLFLLNSVIASIIMYNVFINAMYAHTRNSYESWEFKKKDTLYRIDKHKQSDTFMMSYSTTPGSSWGFLEGRYELKNNIIYFWADSITFKINDHKLIGFRKPTDTINLKKVVY